MKNAAATVVLLGLLSACAQPAPPPAPAPAPAPVPPVATAAPAQVDRFVSIRGATCATFLALSDDDRASASMFYMGYQASRARLSRVNVGMIPTITGMATEYCQAEPNRTVASVFAEAYLDTRHLR